MREAHAISLFSVLVVNTHPDTRSGPRGCLLTASEESRRGKGGTETPQGILAARFLTCLQPGTLDQTIRSKDTFVGVAEISRTSAPEPDTRYTRIDTYRVEGGFCAA
jgi:hypothetical protein